MICRICTASIAFILSLSIPAGSAEVPRVSSPPAEKETALGKVLAAEVERNFRPLRNTATISHETEVGRRLVANAELPFPLTVRLVDTPELVAAALPGGYLVLSSGLIDAARTGSELAGLMAHEIAHIAARHGMTDRVFTGVGMTGVCTRFGNNTAMPVGLQRISRRLGAGGRYALGRIPQSGRVRSGRFGSHLSAASPVIGSAGCWVRRRFDPVGAVGQSHPQFLMA